MEKISEYWKREIKIFIINTINDLNILLKEIESLELDDQDEKDKYTSVSIILNWKEYIYCELSNYFSESELLYKPENLVYSLYRLVLKFRVIGDIINSCTEEEKIVFLSYVNLAIVLVGNKRWFKFSFKYREMILIELGLDYIDKEMSAKKETQDLIDRIMKT